MKLLGTSLNENLCVAHAARYSKLHTPAVYPRVVVNYDFCYFSLFKLNRSIYNLKIILRTFSRFSRAPQSKFEANRSSGLWFMTGHTNKQRLLYINWYRKRSLCGRLPPGKLKVWERWSSTFFSGQNCSNLTVH